MQSQSLGYTPHVVYLELAYAIGYNCMEAHTWLPGPMLGSVHHARIIFSHILSSSSVKNAMGAMGEWFMRVLIPRPFACEANVLPTELTNRPFANHSHTQQ